MLPVRYLLVLLYIAMFGAHTVFAQEFFVYPTKGQDAEQQKKDEFECYNWAKQQSGFDPMALPTASAPPPQQEAQEGGLVRGGLRGAAAGAAVGAIAGDAGKGAAIGAASGGLFGGARRRNQEERQAREQQQWEQQQVAEYTSQRNNYNRGYTACLEGRGYTVK